MAMKLVGWWITLKGFWPQSYSALITYLPKSREKRKLYLHYQSVYWPPNSRMSTYLDRLPTAHKVTWLLDIVLHDNVTNKNHYISTTRVPMAAKLCRIIYLDGLLTMKSYDLWSSDLGRSFDQLTPLYLHCHSAYGPQTWFNGYIPWRLLTTKSYKALIMWYCKVTKTNKNHCISTRVPIATKLGRMMTYLDVLPPIRVYSKPMFHLTIKYCPILWKFIQSSILIQNT